MPSKALILTLMTVLLSLPAPARLANHDTRGLHYNSVERILKLDPEDVDLATAVLVLSQEWGTRGNWRRYRSEIDELAEKVLRIAERNGTATDNLKLLSELNDYLYDKMKLKSVKTADDPHDLLLHSVLKRRQGYCLSLSVLYLSIGERLGLPVYGVVVPGHFFVRYDDGRERFNIETTSGGGRAPDSHYIEKFGVPDDPDTIYLRNLTKLETLGCFFNNLGNCYFDNGNTEAARIQLERAIQANPGLAEAYNNLGNVYLSMKLYDKALTSYENALALNEYDSKTYNNLANVYYNRQEYPDALYYYQIAEDMDSNNADIYLGMAHSCRELNQHAEALDAIEKGRMLDPAPKWFREFGITYQQMGHNDTAITYYRMALEMKPKWPEVYFDMALAFGNLGYTDQQIQAYKDALRQDPEMLPAMQNLSNIYIQQEEYERAIPLLRKALNLEPKNPQFHFTLGLAYAQKKLYNEAIKSYSKALVLKPNDIITNYNLAVCYYNQENWEKALKYAIKAEEFGFELPEGLIEELRQRTRAN